MASKAWVNTVAYLSIVAGASILLKQKYKGRTLHTLTDKLSTSVDSALDIWDVHFDMSRAEDISKYKTIEDKTKEFDRLTFGGDIADPKVLTSTLLGVSNQMEEVVKESSKRHILDVISEDLNRLHRYFDSRGRAWDSYAKAENTLTIWNKIFNEGGGSSVPVSSVRRHPIPTNANVYTSRKKKPLVRKET